MSLPDSHPSSFRAACREVLEHFSAKTQMALWMVTRVSGEEWSVVDVIDLYYGVVEKQTHEWSDSFSYRMIMGLGPKVAPRVSEVPAYVNSVAYQRSQIGAYIAIPLELPDGRLFGTISATNPDPMTNDLHNILPELEAFGQCLMHIYNNEVLANKLEAKISHLETPRWHDIESGALRFDAWLSDCIDAESARINYCEPSGLIYIPTPGCNSVTADWLVRSLQEEFGDDSVIYREDAENFFAVLRGVAKFEQQMMFKEARRLVEKRFPTSKCTWCYRELHSTMLAAFSEAKKLSQSKPRPRKSA